MPRNIPLLVSRELRKQRQASPTSWFFRIVADVTEVATTVFYLVANNQETKLDGATYYPYPIRMGDFEETSEGNLPLFEVQLGNPSRLLSPYIEAGKGFRNQRLTAKLAMTAHVDQGPILTIESQIRTVTMTNDGVAFTCEAYNPNDLRVPQARGSSIVCGHEYGGPLCGVVLDATFASTYPTCPKSLAACIERGDHEASLGRPRLHPRRFGGFPGVNPQVRT